METKTRYAIENNAGRWGQFTTHKDAERAAKAQRAADRQAGNAPGSVRVVKIAERAS